jgi:ABC-type transporter Mla subunit MlaD
MTALEEIAALKGQLAELQASFDAMKTKADADAPALAAALQNVAALTTERDTIKAAIDKATADHTAAIAAAAEKLATTEGELAKAKGALRDPAFAAAALRETDSVPAGAEAGHTTKDRAQLESEYAAIQGTDRRDTARLQAEFRKQHAQALGL